MSSRPCTFLSFADEGYCAGLGHLPLRLLEMRRKGASWEEIGDTLRHFTGQAAPTELRPAEGDRYDRQRDCQRE